nr:MAG TPA: hypothetical protein [Caudoviricetes sp.]
MFQLFLIYFRLTIQGHYEVHYIVQNVNVLL